MPERIKTGDFTGSDLCGSDLSGAMYEQVCFDQACLDGCNLENAWFKNCSFRKATFRNANMKGLELRGCDLTGADICGADLHYAVLEDAIMEQITADESTRYYYMKCPERGAFLGYKKCFNDRLVQLLVPADAKRSSATNDACRCSRAKVLTIKSFDYKENFTEAWSLVDEDFVYRAGEYVEVDNFNENRWKDSTTGIHFWMTRAEALAY